jgi:hypothetical protein
VILSWVFGSSTTYITRKRFIFLLVLLAVGGVLGQVYMRRRWLRYQKDKALSEIDMFVANSHDFDGSTTAALALIQEVELVSRGYRMYDPYHVMSSRYAQNGVDTDQTAAARLCRPSAGSRIARRPESVSAFDAR